MKINELHNQPVEADTYEASMALNQLLKIGKHAIKIHNMIDDSAEMEAWVGKKIDLAGDYVKKVHGYMQGENAGLYDDDGMTEDTLFGMKDPVISISDRNGKHLDTLAMSVAAKKYGFNPAVIRPQFKHQDKVKWNNLTLMAPIAGQPQPKGIMQRMFASEDDKQQASDKEVKMAKGVAFDKRYKDGNYSGAYKTINKIKPGLSDHPDVADALRRANEDAGEGHMSKSTLYHTAKYAIELMDMIKKGDDLEGWVQSKLNKAADYLQGVHNYEEYQKLNPYREELDANTLQKHAQVVQKNIDEILARETSLDDVDTKPGMMRILAKRVNEVEKEMAKENRKNTDEAHGGQHTTSGRSMTKGEMNKREKIVKGMKKDKAGFKKRYGKDADAVMYATATKQAMEDGHTDVPSAIRNCETIIEDAIQMKQKLQTMEGELPSWMTQMIAVAASDLNDARDYLLNPTTESGIMYRAGVKKYGKKGMTAIQSAAGKGASHQEIGKIKDKYLKDAEELEEGLKDWARNTAMAGIIVAGLAGVGSINDAIDRSIPAIGAMETALEMANDSGNDELADMIEKDLSDAKVRLNSGKDLSYVKDLQSKYAKFIKTEGLAYESKLAINLNQRLK